MKRSARKSMSIGITPKDIVPYSIIPLSAKRDARARAMRVLNNMVYGRKETSILTPCLIHDLWSNSLSRHDRRSVKLMSKESYDGGTVFWIEKKVQNKS